MPAQSSIRQKRAKVSGERMGIARRAEEPGAFRQRLAKRAACRRDHRKPACDGFRYHHTEAFIMRGKHENISVFV
jgi:hypothetical protein